MPTKYTIEDVAKIAGVSRGTVSRVLNNHPSVSNEARERVLEAIEKFDSVLGVFGQVECEMLDEEIESLIEERQQARRNRNFARSDEIRDLLAEKGIILEDTKDGVRWKRK